MSLQKIAPEAFAVFKKSILPAKLAVTHNNGDLLLKQVQKNLGRVPDESVPELEADAHGALKIRQLIPVGCWGTFGVQLQA